MKEETKFKIKKYGKVLIPVLLLALIVITKVVGVKINATPSTLDVSNQNLGMEFKQSLANDSMLMIKGGNDRFTYEWFYDKGSITSIYDTDLTLYEASQWEEKVEEVLSASEVLAFQYSEAIQLNGNPVLTVKLLHKNSKDIALYQIEDGALTYLIKPIINLYEDGVEVTFPVSNTLGIYCIVFDSTNKLAVTSLDNSKEEVFLGEDKSSATVSEVQEENQTQLAQVIGNSNESEKETSGEMDSKPVSPSLNKQSKQSSLLEEENGSSLSDMEKILLDAKGIGLNQVVITEDSKTVAPQNKVTEKTEQSDSTPKNSINEDQKPSRQGSSLNSTNPSSNSSTDSGRVLSDGTQTLKDEYETDPVPEGKPLPVEPENSTIDYSKVYQCTISIDCTTILNNQSQLDLTKVNYVPADGIIMKSKNVVFYEGESVFDVLLRETQKAGIQMEYSMTPIYNSNYIEGINNLYEFDCGNLSGWMYSVNGWYPNYGCSRYMLSDGEIIQWRYTCDLGRDLGCDWLDK